MKEGEAAELWVMIRRRYSWEKEIKRGVVEVSVMIREGGAECNSFDYLEGVQ